MKQIIDFKILANESFNDHAFVLKLHHSTFDFESIKPGQFVEVRVDHSPTTFLRRPISVNNVDIENKELWLLIHSVGDGTKKLSTLREGDLLNVVLPLGNGFTTPEKPNSHVLLIGGGVGVAPLLHTGQVFKSLGHQVSFLLGARTANDLLQLDLFAQYGDVYCTTEDGSLGEKGYVTDHSVLNSVQFDAFYTCGPKPMMISVARCAAAKDIFCEVSLENTMACGFGVCLCCVEKTVKGHQCVCTEGPVFNLKELQWPI